MTAAPGLLAYVATALELRVQDARGGWRARGAGGPHAAVDAVLAGTGGAAGSPAETRAAIRARLEPARAARDADAPLNRLAALCELDEADRDLLALLAAAQLEPRLEAVLGYVEDDIAPRAACPASAGALFGWPLGAGPGPASALVRWAIAAPTEPGAWQPPARWELDPDVARYLAGTEGWERFWPGLRLVNAIEADCLYPEALAEMHRAAAALAGAPAPELELAGRPGSGRRTLLTQLCGALGRPALVVERPELGVRALRTARLLDAVPVWVDPPGPVPTDTGAGGLTLTARERPLANDAGSGPRVSFSLPALGAPAREQLWRRMTSAEPPPAAVRDWALTPAELRRAAAAAPAGERALQAQLRRRIGGHAASLMRRVPCAYDWDDLVVAEPVRRALRDLEGQVRLADAVLDGWGFRRLTPERRGTTALFAGPSGTGKTMAASVLARGLELDLYRVDLSQVVDKYIGETEKRLAQVFDECERSRVIVLFDEADALFGQRTRVRDAHDRFANIEIDYLLSRLDGFDGLAILATNRKSDLDQAFMRRIRIIVDFLAPTPAERRRLWELSLPPCAPDGAPVCNGVDRDALAATLQLSPAEIKAVALGAAFLARAAGELIGAEHLTVAARRELAKRGLPLREPGQRP